MAIDAIGFRRLSKVTQDRGAIGDRCGIVPWAERVAESRHVRVRANARIAKEIPGATDRVARFQDGERRSRPLPDKMAGRSDSGQARADDENVEMRTFSVGRR